MSILLAFLREYAWTIATVLVLVVITVFVFRPKARRRYERDAQIPFERDNNKHD